MGVLLFFLAWLYPFVSTGNQMNLNPIPSNLSSINLLVTLFPSMGFSNSLYRFVFLIILNVISLKFYMIKGE